MKSLKEISWLVSEEEYRADSALSYSTIARYDREGFRQIPHLFDKLSTPSLSFGSAVDTLITDGEEAFKERFLVASFPSTSDALITIAKTLFNALGDKYRTIEKIPTNEIIPLIGDYGKTWAEETKVNKIKSGCSTYYRLLALSKDKIVLSEEEYKVAMRCVTELKTNNFVKWYFNGDSNEQYEKLYQLKFKAEYDGIPIRCMMDLCVVDRVNKIIYPIDLKTSGHPEDEFEKSFIQWRYFIQAQLYTYCLKEAIEQDEYFKDFSIAPYRFIVINRYTVSPMVWIYKDNFSEKDLIGPDGTRYRNWRKLVKELTYYLDRQIVPKYPIEAEKSKGHLIIGCLKEVEE